MTCACGACALMSPSMVSSRPGSVVLAYFSPAATAAWQEAVECRTQVCMIEEKPTSLPPMVTLTRVVDAFRADSWLLMTSLVRAPEQAAKVNEAGELAVAHRFP